MEKQEILNTLRQRPPMLFVDDILEVEYGKRVVGVKKIGEDEPWLQGHFPGEPIFPGVLMLETMAQIGCFIYYHGEGTRMKVVLSKIEEAKFLQKVYPGNELTVEGTLKEEFENFSRIRCIAKVSGKTVAKADITYYITERQ